MSEAGSYLTGTAAGTLAQHRTRAVELCSILADASESFGGTIVSIERADCLGSRERGLARIVDAYAALDQESATLAEGRDRYASCYAAYDVDTSAMAQNELVQHEYALSDCIRAGLRAAATKIGSQIVENNPARDAAEADARAALDGSLDAADRACELAAESSDSAGGSLARLYAANCSAGVAVQIGAQLAPSLWGSSTGP